MFNTSYGKCLETCVSKIIEDPGILNAPSFKEMLGEVALEWGEISEEINGGNETRYNLCRMGKYIREIVELCNNPHYNSFGRTVDWKRILADVKYINEIVRHEFMFNIERISPNPRENEGLDKKKYKRME